MDVVHLQLISAVLVPVLDDVFDEADDELQQFNPFVRSQLIAQILDMYYNVAKNRDETVFGCLNGPSRWVSAYNSQQLDVFIDHSELYLYVSLKVLKEEIHHLNKDRYHLILVQQIQQLLLIKLVSVLDQPE